MSINPEIINVKEWVHSPLATLAKQGTQEQYENDYSVGSLIVGGAIRVISLAAYVPASILDLVLSPFINLAIFFGAITNSESLKSQNQRLSREINQSRQEHTTQKGRLTQQIRELRQEHTTQEDRLNREITAEKREVFRLKNKNADLTKEMSLLRKAGEKIAADNKNLKAKNAESNESYDRVTRAKTFLDAENAKLNELNKKLLTQDMQSKKPLVESDVQVDKHIQEKVIASTGGPSERYTSVSDLVVNNRNYPEKDEGKHSQSDLGEEVPPLEPQFNNDIPKDRAYAEALKRLDNVSELILDELIPENLKYNGPSVLDYLKEPATTPEAQRAISEAYTAVKVVIFINTVYVLGFATYAYYQKDIDQYLMAQANSVINQWKEMPNSSSIIDAAINYTDETVNLVKEFSQDAFNEAQVFPNFSAQVAYEAGSGLASVASNAAEYVQATPGHVGDFLAQVVSEAGSALASGASNAAEYVQATPGHVVNFLAQVVSEAGSALASGASNAAEYVQATAGHVGDFSSEVASKVIQDLGNRELVVPLENITQPQNLNISSNASVNLNQERLRVLSESSKIVKDATEKFFLSDPKVQILSFINTGRNMLERYKGMKYQDKFKNYLQDIANQALLSGTYWTYDVAQEWQKELDKFLKKQNQN